MLVPVSTLLARGRRHTAEVPFFTVSSAEIIEASLSEAASRRASAVMVIDLTRPHTMSLASLLAVCREGAAGSGEIGVSVRLRPEQAEIERAFQAGAPSIMIASTEDTTRATSRELCHWAVREGSRHSCEVVGCFSGLTTPAKIAQLVQETGIHALLLPIGIHQHGKPLVSLAHLKDLCQSARVPLVAEPIAISPELRRQCLRSGVLGFRYLPELLEEAYTAGLRTGLRDRSHHSPASYLRPAVSAVRQAVQPYLKAS